MGPSTSKFAALAFHRVRFQANRFWWRWLLVVSVAVILFGPPLVIVPHLPLWLFNLLLFSSAKTSVLYAYNAQSYIKEAHAVLGAAMVGWSISSSILAWFVLDTGFSLRAGYGGNVALNMVFLTVFAVPLARTYRASHQTP